MLTTVHSRWADFGVHSSALHMCCAAQGSHLPRQHVGSQDSFGSVNLHVRKGNEVVECYPAVHV